jgi:hypothetical protein
LLEVEVALDELETVAEGAGAAVVAPLLGFGAVVAAPALEVAVLVFGAL